MNNHDAIETDEARPRGLAQMVQSLVMEQGDPAHVIELHYWTQEPGLLEVVRALVALPEQSRTMIEVFLSAVTDKQSVGATIDEAGRLTLSSPQMAETMLAIREIEKLGDDAPILLDHVGASPH